MKLYDKSKLKADLVASLERRGIKNAVAMMLVFKNEERILDILSTQLDYVRLMDIVKNPTIIHHLRLQDQEHFDKLIQGRIEFYTEKILKILKNKKIKK